MKRHIFQYTFTLQRIIEGNFVPIPAIEHLRTLRPNVEEEAKELTKFLFIVQEFYIEPDMFLRIVPMIYVGDTREFSFMYKLYDKLI